MNEFLYQNRTSQSFFQFLRTTILGINQIRLVRYVQKLENLTEGNLNYLKKGSKNTVDLKSLCCHGGLNFQICINPCFIFIRITDKKYSILMWSL